MCVTEKEFGKMQSDLEYVKKSLDENKGVLRDINDKIDKMVAKSDYARHIERADDIERRVEEIEKTLEVEKASFWHKVGEKVEILLIALAASGLMGVLFNLANQNKSDVVINKTVEEKR